MTWDIYTGFTLLTGIAALPAAVIPGFATKERVLGLLGGLVLIGYAIDGASRTSGIFFYNAGIFVFPFALLAYYIYKIREIRGSGTAAGQRLGRQRRPARFLGFIVAGVAGIVSSIFFAAMSATDDVGVLQPYGLIMSVCAVIPLVVTAIPAAQRKSAAPFIVLAALAFTIEFFAGADVPFAIPVALGLYAAGWSRLRGAATRAALVGGLASAVLAWTIQTTGFVYTALDGVMQFFYSVGLGSFFDVLLNYALPIVAGASLASLLVAPVAGVAVPDLPASVKPEEAG
jgi:hypothetical protein